MKKPNRILLTGAAGALGTVLRTELRSWTPNLRITDRVRPADARPEEEVIVCDLADRQAVLELTRDVDVVVHMGGAVGGQLPFEEIVNSNYLGFFNLYEACRKNGVKRIIWGSSNHAIGFYRRTQVLDSTVVPRPDSDYGVSKVFGETMAQYYWDKYKLESVSIRIGSCFPKPTDIRMLATWLSYADLVRLVKCCVQAARVEHTLIYGVSNNDEKLWDNRLASHLGYRPKDNAEFYREEVEAAGVPIEPDDLAISVHGGGYAAMGPVEQ
ncbi:NAD-dependent epimerase/dehydratase family protein [Paraburkholderia sp.]|uniref:NAD-dependent epimerase/dehydratase family protein n=1 Tax=Paraburkholderia sp. TaxID=1926495 RepID=UPI003C7E63E5